MGEEGEYVCMVGFLTTASHMEWSQAAIDRQKEKYPNMKLIDVERVETEDSMEVAYEKAKELLKQSNHLDEIPAEGLLVPGMVSRKKQFVPSIIATLQQ